MSDTAELPTQEQTFRELLTELCTKGTFYTFNIESKAYDIDFTEWLERAKRSIE